MRIVRVLTAILVVTSAGLLAQGRGGGATAPAPAPDTPRVAALKTEALAEVDKLKDFTQQVADQIFSYGELGFQEF